ncbi:MAG: PVC-type heme-binding CxxCH protein, partial [Leadbetterella sp.]
MRLNLFLITLFALIGIACTKNKRESFDRFPEEKTKENISIQGLELGDPSLEIHLFVQEPDVINPTNMAIDAKGRIWICEAYNYRNESNFVPYNTKGDRISILEDTNQDGKADKKTIFYQGEDVNAALGIVVLGEKVIVSCTPNVFVFTDKNHDDIPDAKEILFKTTGGYQSDHGIHSFSFGPDGKLYFNFGNHAEALLDAKGNIIKDIYGREVRQSKAPFQDGMLLRCDENGKNIEVLAWNFRNNYEACVDGAGRIWQSDNDDDGVRANRINYILENGNYGYKDEFTGADWRVARANLEDSIFLRHWHQNDPGVVPNAFQTYSGSPTGIVFNEWEGLGAAFSNTLILADAGTNEVNAYTPMAQGGGYTFTKKTIVSGKEKDMWFRPSDVAFGSDGSLFVADWYDSGVGGHFIGDLKKGRIYKISKKGNTARKSSDPIDNLSSPNQDTRYQAYQKLRNSDKQPLNKKYLESNLTFEKCRQAFLLNKTDKHIATSQYQQNNELSRINALHLGYINKNVSQDASDIVRAVAMTKLYKKKEPDLWLGLAQTLKKGDKWSLEALGIGAESNWDAYMSSFVRSHPEWMNN